MNDSAPVTTPDLCFLDQDLGADAAAVIRSIATRLQEAGRISDVDVFVDAALAREALGATVLPGGIGMPHARSAAVVTPTVVAARLPEPVTWSAGAEPVQVVLLIAAAGDDSQGYLAMLQKVASACVKLSFVSDLTEARSPAALSELVGGALGRR